MEKREGGDQKLTHRYEKYPMREIGGSNMAHNISSYQPSSSYYHPYHAIEQEGRNCAKFNVSGSLLPGSFRIIFCHDNVASHVFISIKVIISLFSFGNLTQFNLNTFFIRYMYMYINLFRNMQIVNTIFRRMESML